MPKRLTGRVAIVTGASRGIGKAISITVVLTNPGGLGFANLEFRILSFKSGNNNYADGLPAGFAGPRGS